MSLYTRRTKEGREARLSLQAATPWFSEWGPWTRSINKNHLAITSENEWASRRPIDSETQGGGAQQSVLSANPSGRSAV